jgi:hypothetical protein
VTNGGVEEKNAEGWKISTSQYAEALIFVNPGAELRAYAFLCGPISFPVRALRDV